MPRTKVLTEEDVQQEAVDEIKKIVESHKGDFIFRLKGEFRITEDGYRVYPRVTISNTDIVYDPVTGVRRYMRWLPGVSTLWIDEQDLDEMVIQRLNMQAMMDPFTFNDGYLRISNKDKVKAEFLLRKNCCENNPYRDEFEEVRYFLFDYEKTQEEIYKKEQRIHQARTLAMQTPFDEMRYHASYLGIHLYDEYGNPKTENGLRAEYVRKATEETEKFLRTHGVPELKYNFLVSQLVQKGEIIINREKLVAEWSSGRRITVLPEREDPIRYLAGYCLTEEGKEFRERVNKLAE